MQALLGDLERRDHKLGSAYDLAGKRVWVAGHRGLVGSALLRRLESEPIAEILTATSVEVDLTSQAEAEEFICGDFIFNRNFPDGTRKLLDNSKLTEIGWKPQTRLVDGITSTYEWMLGADRSATP